MKQYRVRRHTAWLALAAAAACGGGASKAAAPVEITVVSYGGAFQEAQRKAFFEPFERETGIRIKDAQWSGEYAKLKAMVDGGSPTWDLVTAAEASIVARGVRDGILDSIDYSGIDKSQYYPEAVTPFSFATNFFSTSMAYDARAFGASRPIPKTWAEFWDVKRFPGKRSLRNDPRTTLEFALLADGVPLDSLYPLDVDRAFRSLDRIRSAITVWWTTGSQPAQLLADREVALASAFNGRIWAAAKRDSQPLAIQWNGGALDADTWIVPRGGRNRDAVMKLIQFTARPEVQAALTQYISYGPTHRAAYANLSPAVRADLPSSPEHRSQQFVFNGEWWAANEARVLDRWVRWQTQK